MNRTTASQRRWCAIDAPQNSMKTSCWLDRALSSHRGQRIANPGCLMACAIRWAPVFNGRMLHRESSDALSIRRWLTVLALAYPESDARFDHGRCRPNVIVFVINNDNKTGATVQKDTDNLHDRPFNASDRRILDSAPAGMRRSARRCAFDPALADKSAVQRRCSSRNARWRWDKLPASAGSWRSAAPEKGSDAIAQYILAGRRLPKLCRLRGN